MTQASKSGSRLRAIGAREKPIENLFFKNLYGRCFRFTHWQFDFDQVAKITCRMTKNWNPLKPPEPPQVGSLPAGLTYLGQMVTHDIVQNTNTTDTRYVSPYLNLDSLYCDWSDPDRSELLRSDGSFKLDTVPHSVEGDDIRCDDFHRYTDGEKLVACIREPRNDENIVLSKLVVFWMQLHNDAVELLSSQPSPPEPKQCYEKARHFVVTVFQKTVVDELLHSLLDERVMNYYFNFDPRFGRKVNGDHLLFLETEDHLKSEFQIPFEFSHAVFRFGHAMVRQSYKLNSLLENSDIQGLFQRSKRPSKYVDLARFFDGFGDDGLSHNTAAKICMDLAGGVTELPMQRVEKAKITPLKRDLKDCVKNYKRSIQSAELGIQARVMNLVGLDLESSEVLPTAGDILRGLSEHHELAKRVYDLFEISLDRYEQTVDVGRTFKGIHMPCNHCGAANTIKVSLHNLPFWLFVLVEAQSFVSDKLGPLSSLIIAEVLFKSIAGAHISLFDLDEHVFDSENPLTEKMNAVLSNRCSMAFVNRLF